jgi:hypothetical protein
MNFKELISNFKLSIFFTIVCLVLSFLWGGLMGLYIAVILSILEVSLSFDNAVVNATVLKKMDEYWQKMFLTVGILIAVFGMRLLFPVLIVSIASHINPIDVATMAFNNPSDYAMHLKEAHPLISAFGGSFLLMVFLKYFLDEEKETHWLGIIERPLTKLGKLESIEIIIALSALLLLLGIVPASEQLRVLVSGILGIIVYVLVDSVGEYMQEKEKNIVGSVVKGSVVLFLYLELLDASFSFDGVIGAFAITRDIILIALGLGIGAMFIRSLTVYLVKKGTLDEYIYLEHGAMYAIGTLAVLMFIGIKYAIPEYITGSIGAILIGLALISSIYSNKKVEEISTD